MSTRFMSVAEIADHVNVSTMSIYRLIHSGDLRAVRIGRSFRVPEQAVVDWLRRHDTWEEA